MQICVEVDDVKHIHSEVTLSARHDPNSHSVLFMCLRPLVATELGHCVISLSKYVFPKFPSKPKRRQTSKRQIVGS